MKRFPAGRNINRNDITAGAECKHSGTGLCAVGAVARSLREKDETPAGGKCFERFFDGHDVGFSASDRKCTERTQNSADQLVVKQLCFGHEPGMRFGAQAKGKRQKNRIGKPCVVGAHQKCAIRQIFPAGNLVKIENLVNEHEQRNTEAVKHGQIRSLMVLSSKERLSSNEFPVVSSRTASGLCTSGAAARSESRRSRSTKSR